MLKASKTGHNRKVEDLGDFQMEKNVWGTKWLPSKFVTAKREKAYSVKSPEIEDYKKKLQRNIFMLTLREEDSSKEAQNDFYNK